MLFGKKQLIGYEQKEGKVPFDDWLKKLKDRKARSIIIARLDRIEETGNAGDCESVGQGVYELKVHFGPGYRIYFGEGENSIVVLLCGGDKSSQKRDIGRAQAYLNDYRRRIS